MVVVKMPKKEVKTLYKWSVMPIIKKNIIQINVYKKNQKLVSASTIFISLNIVNTETFLIKNDFQHTPCLYYLI